MMCGTRALLPVTLVLTLAASVAGAEEFVIRPGKGNEVVFRSKAPIESFEGRTSKMDGSITLEPTNVGDSVSVRVEVDLASLDTGIAKRNQHMREHHLETDRYPRAVFAGAAVLGPADARLTQGEAVPFDVEGTFSLHGVSRRLRTTVLVTLASSGGKRALQFEARFPVSLADYSISRPQFLVLKLADVQQVTVRGVAIAP